MTPDSLFALAIQCTRWRDGILPRDPGSSRCACSSVRLQKGHASAQTSLWPAPSDRNGPRAGRCSRIRVVSCKSAAASDMEGQYPGWACHTGCGNRVLPKNPSQSLRWLAAAANQGHQEGPSSPSASCSSKARAARRTSSPRGDGDARPRPGAIENWRVRRLLIVDQTRKASSLQRDRSWRTTVFWGSVRRYSSRPWPLMRWVPKPRFVMTLHPIP